ncbi:DREV methyltransferase [Capsaspora owczarzaki ATCC 30864]|uniref:DREV methyltransferase n=2 Tax=Capsaspora owczarzaki (strain ATCC 30864) TaxID=595528 RepID=A0A0D2VU43_CAPO3|nr:DREV methyltransferase [Capsaspora owczarzaki ATCC 30864]
MSSQSTSRSNAAPAPAPAQVAPVLPFLTQAETTKLKFTMRPELLSPELASKYVHLGLDEGTAAFLEESYNLYGSMVRHYFHSLVMAVLRPVLSMTGVNGLLLRGQMHVASTEQFAKLLTRSYTGTTAQSNFPAITAPSSAAGADADAVGGASGSSVHLDVDRNSARIPHFGTLLDIGAGDGNVTARLAPMFASVTTTEASAVMSWRLAQRGFTSINTLDLHSDPRLLGPFDVISCLNVLDRCERPRTLLQDIRSRLTPKTGRVILAIVLPFRPYVEFASTPEGRQNKPVETVQLTGVCFEQWAEELIHQLIEPAGFTVEAMGRSPYLCHGDLYRKYYVLDDLLLVLRPRD